MRFIFVLSLLLLSFSITPVLAAPKSNESHSHNGRVHKHLLPASGKKHFHKHMHNGRAHIHPFSPEIGFNHTHNKPTKTKENKEETLTDVLNKIEHKHGGRPHSHVLPPSGVNHLHRHWHGNRAHTHPPTKDGAIHFHPELEEKLVTKKKNILDEKITELLKRPIKKVSYKKKYTPKKKQKTIRKTKKISSPKKSSKQLKVVKKNKDREIKLKTKRELNENSTDEVGSANRQYEIGLRYEQGQGVLINLEQAFKWYTRAALQGDARAQFNLASLYEDGRGVKRNFKQAAKWYRKAAENRCECLPKTK